MTGARRVLVGLGTLVMAYAVAGALHDAGTQPVGQVLFLAAGLLAHDLVLLPAAIGVGALIGRVVRRPTQAVVRAAAFASAILTLIALPFVIGAGRRTDDPSALPLDYGRGLAMLLLYVWLAAGAALFASRLCHGHRRKGHRRTAAPPDADRRLEPDGRRTGAG